MKELITIQSKLKAPKGQYNSFGKYKYRSCEDILEAVKPLLAETECTLTLSDEVVALGNRFYVKATATLTNKDGQVVSTSASAREEDTKKGMDGSQITGASSSYARKYALNGLFAIDDTKDSDTTNTGSDNNTQSGFTQHQLTDALNGVAACKNEDALVKLWHYYCSAVPALTVEGSQFYNACAARRREFQSQAL